MKLELGVLLFLIGVLLALSTLFVLPFLEYFLLAVLLAYVLAPLQDRLEDRVGPRIAAATLVLGAAVSLVIPLVFVARATVAEATSLIRSVREGEITFDLLESEFETLTGMDVDLAGALQEALGGVELNSVVGVFGAVTHVLIGVGLTLFLLYYFLKDADRFVSWFRTTVPLEDEVVDDLFVAIDEIMSAVLMGHVLIAIFQGVIAGIGLVAVGIPNSAFWTAVMVVLSLLPIVGSFLVWGPASVYLAVGGDPVAGVALAIYGTVVVGVSDDYLRPVVVDRYAEVNPSVIIIGVLGGLYVLGFMGIFFGPIVIGMLRPALDVFNEEFGPVRVS